MSARDTSRDGWKNRLEGFILTHFKPMWRFLNRTGWLGDKVNAFLINSAVLKTKPRPFQFSTMAPYTSWASLTDMSWSGRHLGFRAIANLPDINAVTELFAVPPGVGRRVSAKSTVLFASFAQWFTDGFLMTNAIDKRKTDTNHQIDLNPVYGLKKAETDQLRLRSSDVGKRGRLKSQMINGVEFPPFLFIPGTLERKPEFSALGVPGDFPRPGEAASAKTDALFALGSFRANTTPVTAAIGTVFLREHNRVAGLIEAANKSWDDDRVFETARNILIVELIKVVVEDYINHISPYHFRFRADPRVTWAARWNKPNWIAAEFSLLYRWHGFIPDAYRLGGRDIPVRDAIRDNLPLLDTGAGAIITDATLQKACELGLHNTTVDLMRVEEASLKQGRQLEIASYNDYRDAMGFPRVTRFEQINGDARIVDGLRKVYGDVDKLEYFTGLFAEESRPTAAVPSLLGRMVAIDAFSQALTNPLLSENVFNEGTFTARGMEVIQSTRTFADIVKRNESNGAGFVVSFDQVQ